MRLRPKQTSRNRPAISGESSKSAASGAQEASFALHLTFPLLDFPQSGFIFFLQPLLGGAVILSAFKRIWQALHIGKLVFHIMGVFIAFAVSKLLHQPRRGVAYYERNGFGKLF